jgi:predicted nuclease of restriction endonuclease-like (RecB) superfamily
MELEKEQTQFIFEIKEKVRNAQYEALKAVNTELINLYWEIGKSITEKQKNGWGKAIVPKLSLELQKEFPGMRGFSSASIWRMAHFYSEYQGDIKLAPLVREISWSKHRVILDKCKDNQQREFYIIAGLKLFSFFFNPKASVSCHVLELHK